MTTLIGKESTCTFGSGHPTVLAAMLINTLKDADLARRLSCGEFDEAARLAALQRGEGTGFLQVMVAHPDLDEEQVLPQACMAASEASGLPLYIDSANLDALRRTLERLPGKHLLSVNGEPRRLGPLLELVKASRSAVICLCMDEHGIPETAEGRLGIAARIIAEARRVGIPDDDLVIDPLVLASGASEPDSMQVTLEVLRQVKQRWGLATFLGIDNAGFAMPHKDTIDLAYLLAAIPAGLDAALLEPPLQSTVGRSGLTLLYAANFISGRDPYARRYLGYLRKNGLIEKKKGA